MKAARIYAIFKAEVLLNLRFKWRFLVEALFRLRASFLFFFMYYGFFRSGAQGIGTVNRENYVVFLLLGLILFSVFTQAFNFIGRSFLEKKWWKAVDGLVASPATTLDILLGTGLAALVEILPLLVLSLTFSWLLFPVSLTQVFGLLGILLLMYLGVLGIGFVRAAFVLTNENIDAWFNILYWMAVAGSCFYYPIVSLPEPLHPLVLANPVYHANIVAKAIWLGDPYSSASITYVAITAAISASLGSYLFQRIFERRGMEG
jgi:ABC-type polysaccharide/polyol phosphate export permease